MTKIRFANGARRGCHDRDRYREYCFNASGNGSSNPLLPSLLEPERASSNPEISTTETESLWRLRVLRFYESLVPSASLSGRAPPNVRHEIDSSVKAFLADTELRDMSNVKTEVNASLSRSRIIRAATGCRGQIDAISRTVRERLAGEVVSIRATRHARRHLCGERGCPYGRAARTFERFSASTGGYALRT